MKKYKTKMFNKKNILMLLSCSFLYASIVKGSDSYVGCNNSFDYFKRYDFITRAHKDNIKGKGYSVSILECNANPDHPYLKGKLEVINPYKKAPIEDYNHGNHVSAIIIGNEDNVFKGGVAPLAKSYLIVKTVEEKQSDGSYGTLKALEEAAKRSHIINLSGVLLEKEKSQKLSDSFLNKIKEILIENDSVLIITASNETITIGQDREHEYLVDLTKDPELASRVLIVANLEYKTKEELVQREDEIIFFQKKVLPLLENFVSSNVSLNFEYNFEKDFKEYLQKKDENLLKFFNILEINCFFNPKNQDNIKNILSMQEQNIKSVSVDILNKLFFDCENAFKKFLESYKVPVTQIVQEYAAIKRKNIDRIVCETADRISKIEAQIHSLEYKEFKSSENIEKREALQNKIKEKNDEKENIIEERETLLANSEKEFLESIRKKILESSEELGVISVISENMMEIVKNLREINITHYSTSLEQYSALHKATIEAIPMDLYYSLNKTKFDLRKKYATDILNCYFESGWSDQVGLAKTLDEVKKKLSDELINIPLDKNDTGILVSTRAGKAAEHFVMAYGQNILSASGGSYGHSISSGSSQAAPIVSGMLILCHEYLKYFNAEISWGDLIKEAKLATQGMGENATGPNQVFGRGLFDPIKLVIRNFR